MRLARRPVTRDTLWPLIRLEVRADQRGLVAPNMQTFAEAAFEPGAQVWGLWQEDTPVGLMAMVDPAGVRLHGPFVAPGAAYLWRLMIAEQRQGQGLGGQALAMAVATARDWGAPALVTGISERPDAAPGFYARHGFRDSGTVEEGDRLLVRSLTE